MFLRIGKLDRKKFVDVYQQFYPHGKVYDKYFLFEKNFRSFSLRPIIFAHWHSKHSIEIKMVWTVSLLYSNRSNLFLLGFVDFNEFLSAIALTMSGTVFDRLKPSPLIGYSR